MLGVSVFNHNAPIIPQLNISVLGLNRLYHSIIHTIKNFLSTCILSDFISKDILYKKKVVLIFTKKIYIS